MPDDAADPHPAPLRTFTMRLPLPRLAAAAHPKVTVTATEIIAVTLRPFFRGPLFFAAQGLADR